MNKYNNGKIYKIVCNITDDVYIGSTIKSLKYRLERHLDSNCISKEIIKNGNYKIELIENYPCNNNNDLRKREQYYIDNLKCINIRNAYKDQKEYNKEYYINNFEKEKKRISNYQLKNRKKLNQYQKEYIKFKKSWGGDKRYNNNLLEINLNIFM